MRSGSTEAAPPPVPEAPAHSVYFDASLCVGCIECVRVCPTAAIRVRGGCAVVDPELCIDCGACIGRCRHGAVKARTATSADLKRFKHTVALPSLTLFAQFGKQVEPSQVLAALTTLGFDSTYDISAMCEMLASATDAYLCECKGPWPKISVTCPAIVRLIQIRYPDMIDNLLPIETPRELAAKLIRRRLASEKGLDPREIGVFFITPCSAIINSTENPVGLEESYLDGAFSIAELYGPLLKAIKAGAGAESTATISERGLLWAMGGGEIAGMRNKNTLTVGGAGDVLRVFDHIEEGKLQAVDFIEAYICPDGCVSGQLTIEGRYAARRNIQQIARRLGEQKQVSEEKVRTLLREHFFDFEEHIPARPVKPLGRNLAEAAARKREADRILSGLPKKDCAACGAPGCAAHAEDVVRGTAALEDCVFVRIERLEKELARAAGEPGKETAGDAPG
jgi:Na+-translocating ferredoxin:NAD+ oxidoreductase RNF subunit RnfB